MLRRLPIHTSFCAKTSSLLQELETFVSPRHMTFTGAVRSALETLQTVQTATLHVDGCGEVGAKLPQVIVFADPGMSRRGWQYRLHQPECPAVLTSTTAEETAVFFRGMYVPGKHDMCECLGHSGSPVLGGYTKQEVDYVRNRVHSVYVCQGTGRCPKYCGSRVARRDGGERETPARKACLLSA
jgi:hypothetical protein